jgi:type II secretory pathway pseudopilin PulG
MAIKTNLRPLMLSAFAGAALMPAYAAAQDAQQTERLQRQIDDLQQQLQTMQRQVADTKKSAAQANALAGAYNATGPAGLTKAIPLPAGVKLSWGGFIEAAGIWRSRNEVADVGSDFNTGIPFPISPLYHENETRFSARQSRLYFQAEGAASPTNLFKAYFEMDFLGSATTANSRESNSYTPRVRHAYLTYDDTDWGWHILAGQSWSLLTQNRSGINPAQVNTPLTIEAQYVVGFNWTRNAQIRVVKDFGPTVSVGVSSESPQVVFQSPGSATPFGIVINSANQGAGSGLMDTVTSYSADTIPDIVEKVAFDPGWGHYEVVGLQRWFTDRVQSCNLAVLAACPGAFAAVNIGPATNNTTTGWGVGGSVLLPVLPKFLDIQGSVLWGHGIGRYGSGQMADVTFARDGSLTALTQLQALVGGVLHLTPDLDIYAYAGLERSDANFSVLPGNTNPIGYGNPFYSNQACALENFGGPFANAAGASIVGGSEGNGTCSVNTRQLTEVTIGFWQNLYKGPMGRVAGGAQFEYIHRDTFTSFGTATVAGIPAGTPLAPATDEAIAMASLRYYFP